MKSLIKIESNIVQKKNKKVSDDEDSIMVGSTLIDYMIEFHKLERIYKDSNRSSYSCQFSKISRQPDGWMLLSLLHYLKLAERMIYIEDIYHNGLILAYENKGFQKT